MHRLILGLWIALLSCTAAFAQDTQARERLRGAAALAPELSFPTQPSRLSIFSGPQMALYKPDGEGPFPALVLHHQCGGLRNGSWQNMAILDWARAAVAHGYVVLVVDSLGPRNTDSVCMGPKNGINFMRGTRDALQAGAHLRTLPYVDKDRIGLAGYSWGAMVALLASSKGWAEALGDGFRFQAAVAFYPGCFTLTPPSGSSYEIVNRDIDRPVLALLGGQDTETPAAECTGRLEPLQAAGAPVRWHLYPEATHCWDCRNLNNFSKVDVRGTRVVYRYDAAATADAERRMFEFLDARLARP